MCFHIVIIVRRKVILVVVAATEDGTQWKDFGANVKDHYFQFFCHCCVEVVGYYSILMRAIVEKENEIKV